MDPELSPPTDLPPGDVLSASPYLTEAPAPPPVSVAHKPASLVFLTVVAGLALAADLATKYWAKENLSGADRHVRAAKRLHVIPNHLDFIFAQNPGGAWSFLRSLPDTLRRPFFLIVSAAAIVFIVSIYQRIRPEQWAMRWGLPLALGGAIGNLVDRIRYGWVVDFVDIFVKRADQEHHWPTFNVADIAIVIGVALMGYEMMRPRRGRTPAAAPPPATPIAGLDGAPPQTPGAP